MSRPTRSVAGQARRKKILKRAKGFYGRANSNLSVARMRGEKAMQYAYRDRRNRKRDFRSLWIQRINAGARQHGMTYSQLIAGLKIAGVDVDRKVLADLAAREPDSFTAVVETARAALQ
ncbi:MAG: 50S ribosomal protein L20 [Pseudomonadota bacterium]